MARLVEMEHLYEFLHHLIGVSPRPFEERRHLRLPALVHVLFCHSILGALELSDVSKYRRANRCRHEVFSQTVIVTGTGNHELREPRRRPETALTREFSGAEGI